MIDEITELRELIGPGFQADVQVRATLGGHVLEFALEITASAMAGAWRADDPATAYAEITHAFGELYARLMAHDRWAARDAPDVRVRFVTAKPATWSLDGTIAERATYYIQGEGSIILVRTSRT